MRSQLSELERARQEVLDAHLALADARQDSKHIVRDAERAVEEANAAYNVLLVRRFVRNLRG